MSDPSLDEFYHTHHLESIVNKPTCFRNPGNPLYIDLVMTNKQEGSYKPKPLKMGYLNFINGGCCF